MSSHVEKARNMSKKENKQKSKEIEKTELFVKARKKFEQKAFYSNPSSLWRYQGAELKQNMIALYYEIAGAYASQLRALINSKYCIWISGNGNGKIELKATISKSWLVSKGESDV